MNANLIIKASAGTGKTFAIATRYLHLLIFGNAKPEQILALTFSRAAAQEIYDKILERLWKAAASTAAADEERETLLSGMSADQKAKAQKDIAWSPVFFAGLLRRIIDAQHHDTIATLDSFIQRIVHSFPLEMGFQKDVSVLDDYGRARAIEKAAEDVLAATGDNGGVGNDFQKAHGNDAMRTILSQVLAAEQTWGAFLRELSRKTQGQDAKNGTEWTADSMREALGIETDTPMPDLSVIPTTGRCGKNGQPLDLPDKIVDKLRKFSQGDIAYGDLFDNQPGLCLRFLLDNPQETSFTVSTGKSSKTTEFGREGAEAIRAAARWAAATELGKKIDVVAAKMRLAKAVERAYDAATRRKGLLTFTDFTDCQAECETSEKGLALQNLQFRLDSRFDHWALDEFQDTSMPQWDCLKRLVEEALLGDGRSVMAVGDFKQSIYAWRGGDDKPFTELIRQVSAADGAIESLDLSYRYQERTARFVNAVFGPENVRAVAGDQCREGVETWERDCWPKEGHLAKGTDDYIEIVGIPVDGAAPGDGDESDDEGDFKPSAAMRILAPSICHCVRDMWEEHEAVGSTDTIGILVRNNGDGIYLAERLRAMEFQSREGSMPIPVVWEGQSGVLDAPVARGVLELLWLAEHPEDTFAWGFVNSIIPLREAVFQGGDDGASAFPTSAQGPAAVSSAILKCLSKMGLARTLRAIVSSLKASPRKLDDRTLMRLDELVREGVNFEARPDADGGIAGFRRYLKSVTDREIAASPDVVRILTIHRSKGLSIDHVIVPVTEKGAKASLVKPKDNTRIAGEGWAFESLSEKLAMANEKTRAAREEAANGHFLEELRTWYVALTRAKKSTRVFVVDEIHAAVQFRDLLRRPFADSETAPGEYGRILHADGTPPPFGRKEGGVAGETPPWTHAKGRDFISHATPSAGGAAASPGQSRRATDLFATDFGSAARRGTDEHAAFAAIERIDPDAPKNERERQILEWGGAWREAFVPSPEATVWRERTYETFDRERKVWETGQFDRVVFYGKGAERTATIYDFKTNRRNVGESIAAFEQRMNETYASQMTSYRNALSRLCGIDTSRITTTLLLTATGT